MFETDLTGQPILVDELDADWLLVLLGEKETAAREAERGKLRLAAQWCALHPATADTGVATWGDTGLPGMRDDYRRLLEPTGVVPETIYLATDRAMVLSRIRSRRGSHPDDYVLSEELAAQHFDHFEPPTADEGPLTTIR